MIPGYSPIEQILNNRGIKNIYHYLHTTDDDILDPSTIMNIKNGFKNIFNDTSQNQS